VTTFGEGDSNDKSDPALGKEMGSKPAKDTFARRTRKLSRLALEFADNGGLVDDCIHKASFDSETVDILIIRDVQISTKADGPMIASFEIVEFRKGLCCERSQNWLTLFLSIGWFCAQPAPVFSSRGAPRTKKC
jgi:hypothetical protein